MEDTPPRPFGVPPDQVSTRPSSANLETTFFTKIGSRVATITAYYEHLSASSSKSIASNSSLPEPNYPPPSLPKVSFVEAGTSHSAEVLYEIPRVTKINVRK